MDAVARVTRLLDQTPGVRLAVLFGSRARQTAGATSDLDIGVSLAGDLDPALQVAIERAAGRRIDLILLDGAAPLLRFEIARNGILLLERDRDAWAEFRAHALIDWWDWAPTARKLQAAMTARLREEATHGPS